jgi:hypothetical protein
VSEESREEGIYTKNDKRSELFGTLDDLDLFDLYTSHTIVELLKYMRLHGLGKSLRWGN